MRKRLLSMLLAISMTAALVTGCASGKKEAAPGETANTGTNEQEAASTENERTLTFLHWRTEDKAAYAKLIANYVEKNPGLKIEMEIIPSGDYDQALFMRTQGGEANDVFACQPGGELMKNSQTGALMDLGSSEGILGNFNADALSAGQVDGTQYAVVQTTNPLAIYYNKDMFKQYGLEVPTTVEEFMNVCKTLKENDITPIAFGAGETWMTQFFIESLIANSAENGQIFSDVDKGKAKLTDEPGVKALADICKEIYDNGYIQEGSTGISEESLLTGFAVGNYAMMSTGTWSMSTVRSINEECDFGVFNMPGALGTQKGVSNTGLLLCVNNDSQVKDDAVGFVEYLTSPEALTYLCNETGQLAVANGVSIEDPDLQMAQALLTGTDGFIPAPFHGVTAEAQKACYGFCTQLLTEKVDDTAALVDQWQKEIDRTKK